MPFHFGTTELIILLVIVILLFGVGRISRLGKDLGTGIRKLREAFTPKDEDEEDKV